MKGKFNISVTRAGASIYNVSFENMILKSGLELLLDRTSLNQNTSLIDTVFFGDGTEAPNFEDVSLSGNRVGVVKLSSHERTKGHRLYESDLERGNSSTTDDYMHQILNFVSIATTFATISEIATGLEEGDDYKLFSKTLVRNNVGEAISLSVAPGDEISVRYVLTSHTLALDSLGTISRETDETILGTAPLVCGLGIGLNSWRWSSLTFSDSRVGCTQEVSIANRDLDKGYFEVHIKFTYLATAPAMVNVTSPKMVISILGYRYNVTISDSYRLSYIVSPNQEFTVKLKVNIFTGVATAIKYGGFLNEGEKIQKYLPVQDSFSVRPFTYLRLEDLMYGGQTHVNRMYRISKYDNNLRGTLSSKLARDMLSYPIATEYVEEGYKIGSKLPGDPITSTVKASTLVNYNISRTPLNRLRIRVNFSARPAVSGNIQNEYEFSYDGRKLTHYNAGIWTLIGPDDVHERIPAGASIVGKLLYPSNNYYLPNFINLVVPLNVDDYSEDENIVALYNEFKILPNRTDVIKASLIVSEGTYVEPVAGED